MSLSGDALDAGPRAITRDSFGTASLSSSSRFADNSGTRAVSPVTFPPGWARLATTPASTSAPAEADTIGIVVVSRFAASAAPVVPTTRTSTGSLMSSETSAAWRSSRACADRDSITMFCPST
jgi:hypothetical protein